MATSIIPKQGGSLTENTIALDVSLGETGTITINSSVNISEVTANITGTTTSNRTLNSLTIKPTASLGKLIGIKDFKTGGTQQAGVIRPAYFRSGSQTQHLGAKIEVSDGNIVATPLEADGSAVTFIQVRRAPRLVLYSLTGIFE